MRLTWFGYSIPSNIVSDCHQVALSLLSWSVRYKAWWSPYWHISQDFFWTPVCLQNSVGRSWPHVFVASISTLNAAFSKGGIHLYNTDHLKSFQNQFKRAANFYWNIKKIPLFYHLYLFYYIGSLLLLSYSHVPKNKIWTFFSWKRNFKFFSWKRIFEFLNVLILNANILYSSSHKCCHLGC